MDLFLLRHGLAVEPGEHGFTRDADRPLTEKGKDKVGRIAEAMLALEISCDRVLSSPYVRARETAEIVAETLGIKKKLEFTEALTPGGNPKKLVELIHRSGSLPSGVLLVGHEPFLSELISLLVSGSTGFPVLMKKGGLCKLSTGSLHVGRCATLEWLLTPRQLLLMT